MKKGGLILLTTILLTYGYQGYKAIYNYINDEVKIKTSAVLSDITDSVISVPLEAPNGRAIQQIRRVQRDENNIFLLAEHRLLHFDISGKFINQPASDISDRDDVFIADYTIDADRQQIIVIDSLRYMSKYDYSGNLISRVKITQPWHKITAFAYHSGYIWATTETLIKNTDNDSYNISHDLCQLDMEMNGISNQRLHYADVGRNIFKSFCINELLVDENSVYAYSSPIDMDNLLNDTLFILQSHNVSMMNRNRYYGQACVYPVRKSKRYMMSTHHYSADDCHTFCYDNSNNTAYMLSEGFEDDFYNTGNITDLQPMDIYHTSYCFVKQESDAPVLFIATLKS